MPPLAPQDKEGANATSVTFGEPLIMRIREDEPLGSIKRRIQVSVWGGAGVGGRQGRRCTSGLVEGQVVNGGAVDVEVV